MKNPKSITVLLLFGLMIFILEAERKLMTKALPFLNEISIVDDYTDECCQAREGSLLLTRFWR